MQYPFAYDVGDIPRIVWRYSDQDKYEHSLRRHGFIDAIRTSKKLRYVEVIIVGDQWPSRRSLVSARGTRNFNFVDEMDGFCVPGAGEDCNCRLQSYGVFWTRAFGDTVGDVATNRQPITISPDALRCPLEAPERSPGAIRRLQALYFSAL